jgi:hypothetical protein
MFFNDLLSGLTRFTGEFQANMLGTLPGLRHRFPFKEHRISVGRKCPEQTLVASDIYGKKNMHSKSL